MIRLRQQLRRAGLHTRMVVLALCAAGCGLQPVTPLPTASPQPTLQALRVAVTPALRPLQPALQVCAAAQPLVGLVLEETHAGAFVESSADIFIRLGLPDPAPAYALPLGWEQINLVTHPENPVETITQVDLRGMYSGEQPQWPGSGLEVALWTYLAGDDLRQGFETASIEEPQAFLAPHPAAMIEGILDNRGAVGYLPGAWDEDGLRIVPVDPALQQALRLPVFLLARSELQGAARNLAECLQRGAGQAALADRYEGFHAGK